MANTDIRIDQYIERAQPFAQPILRKLREMVHLACPEVEEAIKWGMPFFDYKGPYCNMASFKQHATFGFWKYSLLDDPDGLLKANKIDGGPAMGNLGKIASLEDLPPDEVMLKFLTQAKKLNDEGIKLPQKLPQKKDVEAPVYFMEALAEHDKANEEFNHMSPSCKREYIEWISDAKTEATRQKRISTAIEWISEGKKRHWKYGK